MTQRNLRRRNTRMRFERWAANPTCQANVAAVVHNVSMSAVARQENPAVHIKESSQLAFERGIIFEASILKDSAARLVNELRRVGTFDSNTPFAFVDFRIGASPTQPSDFDAALVRSTAWLQSIPTLPPAVHLVAGLATRIPRGVMLPEASLILDVLLVDTRTTTKQLIVGEVKSYSDRGGFTKASSLATARAQAGVYVHALNLVAASLDIKESCMVSDKGFLVLTKPGRNFPTIRWDEDLKWQAERARRGFELLEKSALDLNGLFAFDEDLPDQQLVDLILHAETNFGDSCLTFCERAPTCQRLSIARDDGAFLGDEAVRFLNGVPLSRAEALINGARPKTGAEQDLLNRFKSSDSGGVVSGSSE